MNRAKKSIPNSIIIFMLFAMLGTTGVLAQSFKYTYKGVEFKCKTKDGKTSIIGFTKDAAKVVIPAEVKNKKGQTCHVSKVDLYDEATRYKTNTIAIEPGITEIEKLSFYLFKKLTDIYIPNTIERIGEKAFNKKHAPRFTMPSNINSDDLLSGLAVYPKAIQNSPVADPTIGIDWSAYTDETNSDKNVANEQTAAVEAIGIQRGTSDIDTQIPTGREGRENTFCLIIANEKYSNHDTPDVKYAEQDGITFQSYCLRTLKVPQSNVRFLKNAKYLDIKGQLTWLKNIAEAYENEANFIVYYAGHGMADEKGNCKLIPSDVSINDVDNGFSLKELYTELGKLTTNNVLVLVDACFSGNDRADVAATNTELRGIVREVKNEVATGNVVVLSATSETETALSYEEQAHGLFSYYLMKKIKETEGNVTYGELYDYIKKNVLRKSVVVKDKKQTPSVTVSAKIKSNWKNMKF